MTPVKLRHAALGYPDDVGERKCPLSDAPVDPCFPDLVVFWLTDSDTRE